MQEYSPFLIFEVKQKMISFNFHLFFKIAYFSLFKAKGTHAQLTRKRVIFLVTSTAIYVPLQLINGFFLMLDWILFPGFRHVEVREPVFIVGNPRTGSTHLLRVLAQDKKTFATPKLWEQVLAPSITQRKIVRALGRLDRRLGGSIRGWLTGWQNRAFQEEEQYRRLRLEEPDEDELGLLTISLPSILYLPFHSGRRFIDTSFLTARFPQTRSSAL